MSDEQPVMYVGGAVIHWGTPFNGLPACGAHGRGTLKPLDVVTGGPQKWASGWNCRRCAEVLKKRPVQTWVWRSASGL